MSCSLWSERIGYWAIDLHNGTAHSGKSTFFSQFIHVIPPLSLRLIDRRYFAGSKQMNMIGKLGGSKMVGRLGSVNYHIAVSFILPESVKFRGL